MRVSADFNRMVAPILYREVTLEKPEEDDFLINHTNGHQPQAQSPSVSNPPKYSNLHLRQASWLVASFSTSKNHYSRGRRSGELLLSTS